MLAVLQWIYGPNAAADPYYQLLHDFVVLMPWWYPYMWLGIIGGVVSWRLARRWRLGRQNRAGLRRVRSRVRRLASESALPGFMLPPANDDLPQSLGQRRAAD